MEDFFTIDFERSGGFTGIPVRVNLSNKTLSPDEQSEIQRLIEIADFSRLQTADKPDKTLPDQFLYRISVETSAYTGSILIYEQEVTDDLRPLIRFLSGKAKGSKK